MALEHGLVDLLIAHVSAYATEVGGVLLGRRTGDLVTVTSAVFPRQLRSTDIHCSFDVRTIDVVHNAIEALEDPVVREMVGSVIGWVHTHPRLSAFLSEQDCQTLDTWTGLMSGSIAMVVDPFDRSRQFGVWGAGAVRLAFESPRAVQALTVDSALHLAARLREGPRGEPSGLWTIVCADGLLRVIPGQHAAEGARR